MTSRICVEGSGWRAKPDILLVADNGHSGGIGRYCVDLAQALGGSASVGCLCPEVCSGDRRCWLAGQCAARDLRLISIAMPTRAWREGFEGLTAVWKAQGRPIVHVNGRRGNFIATLAKSLFSGFTFVTTVHGVLGLHARRNAAYRLVDLGASRAANAVVAVSADTRRRLVAAGVPSGKTLTISNGLALGDMDSLTALADSRALTCRSATNLRVGFLGRLSPEKGIDEFVRLASILSAEGSAATFTVAGDGPALAAFVGQSAALVANGRLDYLGDISDPSAFLGNVDILVMPSHNEGLPYVLLEAMAAGCAVVAYGVGGIPEVVTDSCLGILVRPLDTEGLMTAVSDLVAQPALARSIGARASEHVRERYLLSQRLPLLRRAYDRCGGDPARGVSRVQASSEDVVPCGP
jgi:glycosyltransferase involved in cell wall biosynthesis